MLQLNPPLPLKHIDKGNFLALFIHDPGLENELMFTGFLDNGEIWTFTNKVLRACKNITLGRTYENQKNFIHVKCSWCELIGIVDSEQGKKWECPRCSSMMPFFSKEINTYTEGLQCIKCYEMCEVLYNCLCSECFEKRDSKK